MLRSYLCVGAIDEVTHLTMMKGKAFQCSTVLIIIDLDKLILSLEKYSQLAKSSAISN